jgi:small acid-soluble spore protein B (major beta-type SASP)
MLQKETLNHEMFNKTGPLVKEAEAALDQLKYEVAMEIGIHLPEDGYYGNMPTRDMGRIGGNMTRKLVQIAEQTLYGQYRH